METNETAVDQAQKPRGVPEYYSDLLGMHYIIGKEIVLFDNGVQVPTVVYREAVRNGVLKNAVAGAEKDVNTRNYDYQYAKTTGYLRKKKTIPQVKELKDIQKQKKDTPMETEKKSNNWTVLATIAVMAVIGAGSIVMSAYHGWLFLLLIGKPLWVAVITGVMFVIFSSTAFTASRYFSELQKSKTGKRGINSASVLFIIFGVFTILFSVTATLCVSYAQYSEKSSVDSSASINAQTTQKGSKATADELDKQYEQKLGDITAIEKDVEYWREKSWAKYESARLELKGAREERDKIAEALVKSKSDAATAQVSTDALKDSKSAYEFIEGVFPWLPSMSVAFFMFAVPSVFYDIIAPFSLFIVMLLIDTTNRKKSKEEITNA